MKQPPRTFRYLVTIHYREPTYQRHTWGDNVVPLHPYRARYEVVSRGSERAVEIALQEFRHTAALSSAGWVRQVVRVDCRCLGEQANRAER